MSGFICTVLNIKVKIFEIITLIDVYNFQVSVVTFENIVVRHLVAKITSILCPIF